MKGASGSLLKRLGQGLQAPQAIFWCVPPSFPQSQPLFARKNHPEWPERQLPVCWQGPKPGISPRMGPQKKKFRYCTQINLFKLYFPNPSLGSHCELVIPVGLRALRGGGAGVGRGCVIPTGATCSAGMCRQRWVRWALLREVWVTQRGVGDSRSAGPCGFGVVCRDI